MNDPRPIINVNAAGPVVIGVPFPKGMLQDPERLEVIGPDGVAALGSARCLVPWPDGSTRWALVSFIADQTGEFSIGRGSGAGGLPLERADGSSVGTRQSQRDPFGTCLVPDRPLAPEGQAGSSSLRYAAADRQGPLKEVVPSRTSSADECVVRESGSPKGIELRNGELSVVLAESGPGPIARLSAFGRTFIPTPSDLRFCVDDADTTHERTRQLRVLEANEARVRARVEGAHFTAEGGRKLSYRLDVELWAGLRTVRLDYQFLNLEPGQDELAFQRIALEADLELDTERAAHHFLQSQHGEFYQPREVVSPEPVAIVTDRTRRAPHVEDPAMLLDDVEYPRYLAPPLVNTPEWLGVTDGASSVYLHMQDLANMQPKRLVAEGTRLSLEIWPERAGTLQLPQGRSRRQVITLTFAEGRPDAPTIEQAMVAPLWEGRARVAPEWLAHCGEFEQDRVLPFGRHGRFEGFLARTMRLNTPADMFDLGDTSDSGYSTSYISLGQERQARVAGAPEMPRVLLASSGSGSVAAPWCDKLSYERVWVNNEYDAIHAFACELMRTGKADHWLTLRWLVRHNIEVDFNHYSDQYWLHRISAVHSARHNTAGGYPSHFWTQGLLEYYCLTGDPDALEVALALGDAILRFFHHPERGKFYRKPDRELGWALLALVHLYDITREVRFQEEIERLAEFFMSWRSANEEGGGTFLNRTLVGQFYFMLNTVEALDLYERITGSNGLADWLVGLLDTMPEMMRQNMLEGAGAESCAPAMAIGYERTGDRRFLEAGMLCIERLVMDDPRWREPVPEAKPLAITYRAVIRFLGHALREGLLDSYEYPGLRNVLAVEGKQ